MVSDRPTLLLVEDDAVIALAETRMLESAGYNVIGALSGHDALVAVARSQGAVDLILMDVDLGAGMDGTQVAQEILRTYDIPILFLSSHTERDIVEKTEKITSYGYVVKDSGDVVLLASIKMAFKLHQAHASLRSSVDQFNKLTGTSMDGFLVIDRHTRILEVNEAYCRMSGYSRDELLGMSLAGIDVTVDAEGRHGVLDEIQHAGPEHFEARHRRKDGGIVDVDMSSTFMREQGRYLVFLKNITERKRAEKSLRESEQRFHSVWTKSADGMRLTDREGVVLDVNDAYCRMVKLPREELVGRVFSIIYKSQGPDDDLTEYKRRFDTGVTLSRFAAPATMWNGEVIHMEISSSFIEQADHQRMLLSLFRDVTDRMKAEEALSASEQLHRRLFDDAPLGYHEVDVEGRIIRVNRTELRVLGYDERDMLGVPIWEFIVESEISKEAVRAKLAGTQAPGTGYERTYKRKDGTTLSALVEDYIIHGLHGEIAGLRSTIQDITARKRAEEALHLLLRQKETLMQELQHRVKNNLSVISSLLALELPRIPDARSREVFVDAQTRIVSMVKIYEQLYSTQSLSHVDLRTYIEGLTRGLFNTYALEAERIRLYTDIISLPLDLRIVVPLGLILNELIANALKYAFPAGASAELRVELTKKGEMLILSVRDNGVGLPDGIDLGAIESMGIRLVMILTEQLGGTVTFESRGGTHVVVTIPA